MADLVSSIERMIEQKCLGKKIGETYKFQGYYYNRKNRQKIDIKLAVITLTCGTNSAKISVEPEQKIAITDTKENKKLSPSVTVQVPFDPTNSSLSSEERELLWGLLPYLR